MSDAGVIVREFLDLMAKRNPDLLRPYLADDAVYHFQGLLPARGADAILEYLGSQMTMFADKYECRIVNLVTNDGLVMTERLDMVSAPTGHFVGVPVAGAFVVENGKIKKWTDYTDRLSRAGSIWTP